MKQQSLSITRRGILWFHWGLEASAALILISLALTLMMMFGAQWLLTPFMYFNRASVVLAPIAYSVMVIGVIMTTAAPPESRANRWSCLTLLAGLFATTFTIAVYWFRLPMQWSIAAWPLLFIQGLLMTRFLAVLSDWILTTERRDFAETEGTRTHSDVQDVKMWGMMKSRFDGLLAGGVGLLMLVSVFGLGVRFFSSLFVRGLGFQAFMLLSALFFLVVLIWALVLLMRFSRYVYYMKGAFRESSSDEPDANAHWDEVSRDRFKPLGIALGCLAMLAIGADLWGKHRLLPEYMAEQVAEIMKQMPNGQSTSTAVGKAAPNMTMTTIDGDSILLSEQRGRPVLLNFWATWCGPCVAEIPDLVRLAEGSEPDGLLIVGISDEPAKTLKPFVKKHQINYPIVSGSDWKAPFDKISSVPTSFLIDGDGVIQNVFVGARGFDDFQAAVKIVDRIAECQRLVQQKEYGSAGEAYEQLIGQSDGKGEARRFSLLAAAAFQADGSGASISKSGQLLISRMQPGDAAWNLHFAAWLLDASEGDRADAYRAAEKWYSGTQERLGNWLGGWVMAAGGEHEKAFEHLEIAINAATSDAFDHLFYARSMLNAGNAIQATESAQRSRQMLESSFGDDDSLQRLPWNQRLCVARLLEAIDEIEAAAESEIHDKATAT